MKYFIAFIVVIFISSPGYSQNGAHELTTIINKCEEKFKIRIAYNISELKDSYGQPIKVSIDYESYRQKDLMETIEKIMGGKFEKLSFNQYVLKPATVVRMEKIDTLTNRISIMEKDLSDLKEKMDRIESKEPGKK